jgi:hypothetical protein
MRKRLSGSNPSCSSGESTNFRFLSRRRLKRPGSDRSVVIAGVAERQRGVPEGGVLIAVGASERIESNGSVAGASGVALERQVSVAHPVAWRFRLCPRGADGLVREQRCRFPDRLGQEQPAGRRDRGGTDRRAGAEPKNRKAGPPEAREVTRIEHGAAADAVEIGDLDRRAGVVDRIVGIALTTIGAYVEIVELTGLPIASSAGIFGRLHPVALLETENVHLRLGQAPGDSRTGGTGADDQDVNGGLALNSAFSPPPLAEEPFKGGDPGLEATGMRRMSDQI